MSNEMSVETLNKQSKMNSVNTPVRKKDAMALLTGKPVYMDDLAPQDCLVVKVLRSPYASAKILSIKTDIALKVPGVECILTYKDVPNKRFTMAGQTYPEPSPYDRLILEDRVRFVGDAVAIVAATTQAAAEKALKLIRVEYEELPAVLDFRTAKDNPILVHPEENWKALCEVGADNKRNLCASDTDSHGDVDKVFESCDVVVEHTYHTKANQQAMMETFRAYSYKDAYGRLNVVASTQIAFHIRRILSNALDIPKSMIRIIKPRIGGGFGAKQTSVAEVYPALVTWITGKKAKMIYTREESQIASTPRHEMEVTVKLGANKDGTIRAAEMYTLSNTGAFGEHGPTTVGLSGHKAIPLYSRMEAHRFNYDVVYTNVMSAGAYRGYGATQGYFAMESCVDELAKELGMDPIRLREINMTKEGDAMPAYYGETATSCALDRCMAKCKELLGWDKGYLETKVVNGKIRAVGAAMAMQGSGISNCDVGSVTIKVNDDGFYAMSIGAADMGTGCDTILAQMAADCLNCHVDEVIVFGVDTDISPYDSGSYASSTTYITGGAVMKTCESLIERMKKYAAILLECEEKQVEFEGERLYCLENGKSITRKELANSSMCANGQALMVTEMNYSQVSPPPFMVGMAEIEVDPGTGKVTPIQYKAVVDCGTVINPNLARVQTEGGLVQGIGMALYEDVIYDEKGKNHSESFMQYRLPSRQDIGEIEVVFESSFEPSGPFGAKSIGEIVINTPSPAIANAVYNATGVRIRELPITPEKVFMGMQKLR